MVDGERVVHRDKRVSRGMAAIVSAPALFLIGLSIFIPIANASISQPAPPLVLAFIIALLVTMGLLFLLLAVAFAVVRTLVTEREVHVKYGLSGPRIPLESITSVRVVRYKWTRFGGWGIRIGIDGTRAYVPGPGDVVEIGYREGAVERKVQIGVSEPAVVARKIQEARNACTGLRFAEDVERSAELEAAAEEEAAPARARAAER